MNNILCIDIGNTEIDIGIFTKDKLVKKYAISSDKRKTIDEYYLIFKSLISERVNKAAIASVVPDLNNIFINMLKKYYKINPYLIKAEKIKSIKIAYKNLKELGADRIANAAAVYYEYKKDTIVIDIGTALTFDIINRKGKYLGGIIFPGIKTSIWALKERTALLPEVQIEEVKNIIGKDTRMSIKAGVFFGYIDLINSMIKRIRKELKFNDCNIIMTGGLSNILKKRLSKKIILDNELTLKGIYYIYKNDKKTL